MEQPIEDTRAIIDKLSALSDDPEEFDRLSREIIQQTIDSFPAHHRRKARGLQFKIDTTLSRCSDPLARMNKMVEIFWEHFQQFHDAFHNPQKLLNERSRGNPPAQVIQLHRPDSSRAGQG